MSSNQLRQRKKEEEKIENTSKNEEQQIETKVHEKTPMEIAQEKYRKFFIRNIWGLLMIGAFALILYSDHFLVAVFVILVKSLSFLILFILLAPNFSLQRNDWYSLY